MKRISFKNNLKGIEDDNFIIVFSDPMKFIIKDIGYEDLINEHIDSKDLKIVNYLMRDLNYVANNSLDAIYLREILTKMCMDVLSKEYFNIIEFKIIFSNIFNILPSVDVKDVCERIKQDKNLMIDIKLNKFSRRMFDYISNL